MNTILTKAAARGRLVYTLFSTVSDGVPHFNITVSSTLFGDETATVFDVTTDELFAQEFLLTIADNMVLPSVLKEIAEEYITAAYTV